MRATGCALYGRRNFAATYGEVRVSSAQAGNALEPVRPQAYSSSA